jgi:UDP-N-acetylglucosamine/UDP-N-acetylgalactosamine diphosphorylase
MRFQDSPDTARALLSEQGKRWLRAAGAIVPDAANPATDLCEVSSLLSYAGEGLDGFVGKQITLPCHLC